MKGFKALNKDWTCRNKQYAVGETFTEDVTPEVCDRGMHFCERLPDVFRYYSYNPDSTVVAEVEALGDVVTDGEKSCTNKLYIIREIPWEEVQKVCNTGNRNTGNRNTGDWNTGNRNTGDWNTGNRNTGNRNTGDWNTGDCNTGDWNTGDWNTGNRNTGDWNTGDWNTGNRNTGNRNTGNRNTGDWNTGDCNTGDWNKASFNNGCFMTIEPKISMFNKPSDWTLRDWWNSRACYLMNQIPKNVVEWIPNYRMTNEEKAAHPEYKTTEGYLKVLDESENAQLWWDSLNDEDRDEIKALPNFDAEIFRECTGIRI